jgi:hypothetical protein
MKTVVDTYTGTRHRTDGVVSWPDGRYGYLIKTRRGLMPLHPDRHTSAALDAARKEA